MKSLPNSGSSIERTRSAACLTRARSALSSVYLSNHPRPLVRGGNSKLSDAATRVRGSVNRAFSTFVGQGYATERPQEKSRPVHFDICIHHLLRTPSSLGWRLAGAYFATSELSIDHEGKTLAHRHPFASAF